MRGEEDENTTRKAAVAARNGLSPRMGRKMTRRTVASRHPAVAVEVGQAERHRL